MGTVNVVLGEDTRLNLILGQQLENAVTEVVFDFSAWQTTYGSGTLALSVQRPGDEMPYAVTLTTSGTDATWSVTNLDTAYKGVGHIQLTYTVGSAIKKSVVYKFTVYESLGANGEYPSPGQTWQEEMEQEITDVRQDLNSLDERVTTIEQQEVDNVPDGLKYENQILYLTSKDVIISDGVEIVSGSGGDSGNNAVLTVVNTTGWLATTVAEPICSLSINWSSIEDGISTGDGMLIIRMNNVQRITKSIPQGDVTVSIGSYLTAGTNNVKLTVSDVYGNSRTINYTVNYYSYALSSTFDRTQIFSSAINYYYVATGAGSKVMHFKVDGIEIGTEVVTSSGRQSNYSLGTMSNGSHTLEAYFTVIVNEQSIESNHLFYDLVYADDSASETIIASSYNDFTVDQYSTCVIPFIVYNPENNVADVELAVDGVTVSTLSNVDRGEHYWSYKAIVNGTKVLSIMSGNTTKTLTLTVNESDIDVHAVTQDLSLYLSSAGRSNSESSRDTWRYNDYEATFTDFFFDTDGWQLDDMGDVCLRVRGSARLTVPYQVFASDCKGTGKTIEFEFTTKDTIEVDSPIISCYSGGIGFVVTPQTATLYSNLTSVSTIFKEDEHVRISFVVNKAVDNSLIFVYINGIMSGCIQYDNAIDTFKQSNPVGITIGSNDATLDLYTIRIYDNNLTRYQILDNWIADTQDIDEMLDRYNRNNIYDEYDEVVISKLPSDLPYMVISGASLPEEKGNKKTVSIEFEDPTGTHPNFTAENVEIDVQGTTSSQYPRKNYKCKFRNGFVINGITVNGYQMTGDSIATKTFTFKADMASSEGANNVELVRLYNDYAPYKTEPQMSNPMIRQGIDGFPMVIFHNDGNRTRFIGKYNFNNDKGTAEVYGFEQGDESWEIKNNTDALGLFKDDDFSNWSGTFEARYPDKNTVITNLSEFVSWVYSTDTTQATNNALDASVTYGGITYTTDSSDYRLAKFKNELSNYANVTALEFYYVFTELFHMEDSRAKNMFPSFFGDGKWLILPYDFDTAIGIDNNGKFIYSPFLDDTDTLHGGTVFTGQSSVLWNNLRTCFMDEIRTVYDTARQAGLSYEEVESRFETHQKKWSEAIFNEDAYFKYIKPLVDPDDGTVRNYLYMLAGSKEQQRKWWLWNRFKYCDNQYMCSIARNSSNQIYFRAYAKANMVLTPAHDTYLYAAYTAAHPVLNRAMKDVPTTMVCDLTSMNNTECYIYGSENVKSLGDMVGLNVSQIDLADASNLQYLKLGDDTLQNTQLTSIDLSNCKKLKVVDLRNCINLTGAIDVSNCYGLEELYLTGTKVTAVNLPRGSRLKKLHLPAVSSLVIINAPDITEFEIESYSSDELAMLWVQNAGAVSDSLSDIVINGLAENASVRLVNINATFDNVSDGYEFWRKIRLAKGLSSTGLQQDKPVVTGLIHFDSCPTFFKTRMESQFSGLTVTYDTAATIQAIPYDWCSSFTDSPINLTDITSVAVKHYHNATGDEDEVVTIIGTVKAYKSGTDIIIADNVNGFVLLTGNNNTTSGFYGYTNMSQVDLTYAVTTNLGQFFANTSKLKTVVGLESCVSFISGSILTPLMFSNSGMEEIDASFLRYTGKRVSDQFQTFNNANNAYVIDMSNTGVWNNNGNNLFFPKPLRSIVSWHINPSTLSSDTFPSSFFQNSYNLTRCIFKTDTAIVFNQNAIKSCPLDYLSLKSVIECAIDRSASGETQILTLHRTTFGLIDDYIANLASSKGYTLASA